MQQKTGRSQKRTAQGPDTASDLSERIREFNINGCHLYVFGTIIGLVSEGEAVATLIKDIGPDIVFLGVPPEAIPGIKAVLNGSVKEVAASNLEVIYAKQLNKYGEVSIPPPSYTRAFEEAVNRGIKVLPIDIKESEYSDMYVREIGIRDIVSHTARSRRLSKRKFKSERAEDFVLEWDAAITKGGFAVIESSRERHMALAIVNFLSRLDAKKALAVVEYQRWNGICANLKENES